MSEQFHDGRHQEEITVGVLAGDPNNNIDADKPGLYSSGRNEVVLETCGKVVDKDTGNAEEDPAELKFRIVGCSCIFSSAAYSGTVLLTGTTYLLIVVLRLHERSNRFHLFPEREELILDSQY